MKKVMRRILPLMTLLFIVGLMASCTTLSVMLTPAEVTDAISRGDSVARFAVDNPPTTEEDRAAYFEVNAELWAELAELYSLRKGESE